ncbi:uncharacterized protein BXZ73DRAFT_76975 [Epithele typhae]|uniref:uncharacterized protein n=1 Tax=Epithele typhae TaxID=378194 RepID=UPI002008467F|nr:uncharacterized protein BXZ73DRAFT_76975 [Epithele typhae]KAH9934488.1 hypothetical protein BXZ73DRAFT_76975 [Epithele typhae]
MAPVTAPRQTRASRVFHFRRALQAREDDYGSGFADENSFFDTRTKIYSKRALDGHVRQLGTGGDNLSLTFEERSVIAFRASSPPQAPRVALASPVGDGPPFSFDLTSDGTGAGQSSQSQSSETTTKSSTTAKSTFTTSSPAPASSTSSAGASTSPTDTAKVTSTSSESQSSGVSLAGSASSTATTTPNSSTSMSASTGSSVPTNGVLSYVSTGGANKGTIVAGVVGGIFALLLLLFAAALLFYRRRERLRRKSALSRFEPMAFTSGDPAINSATLANTFPPTPELSPQVGQPPPRRGLEVSPFSDAYAIGRF